MDAGGPVSELGESALIERFAARLAPAPDGEIGSGDDAALVRTASTGVLFTTDVLVEGVDFDLSLSRGQDIGWKAVTANISDVAAMGGRPTHALATLCLTASTQVGLVDAILDGVLAAAGTYGLRLVGGDVSSASEISLGLALLGAAPGPVVRRSGARVDDAICVTGSLGGAAAGLELLRAGNCDAADPRLDRQLRPRARVEEGVRIAAGGATAMIDVSDGLAVDMAHICAASGVGCALDSSTIPIDDLARETDDDALPLALTGGEDFELLFTLADGAVVPEGATRIGTVVEHERSIDGQPLQRWEKEGWQHLRTQ